MQNRLLSEAKQFIKLYDTFYFLRKKDVLHVELYT